jgi:hypothetical protein
MDADLYFASADNFKDMIRNAMRKQSARFGGAPVTHVVLDMSTITHMDTTGLRVCEPLPPPFFFLLAFRYSLLQNPGLFISVTDGYDRPPGYITGPCLSCYPGEF